MGVSRCLSLKCCVYSEESLDGRVSGHVQDQREISGHFDCNWSPCLVTFPVPSFFDMIHEFGGTEWRGIDLEMFLSVACLNKDERVEGK